MKVVICGDFTSSSSRSSNNKKDNNILSKEVSDVINKSDISIINLESPVAQETDKKIDKYGPALKTDVFTIENIKNLGFNATTLANNHFCDYGNNGVKLTIKELQRNNIDYVGGGINETEQKRSFVYVKGNDKLSILNCCESEFSVDHNMGSNKLDPIALFYDIKKAKDLSQYVIVIIHGGHEGYQLPSPRMKQWYRFFIDCGANVVINHHQHCYSGYEEYHGGVIFYGLGNFFFDSIFPHTPNSWFEGYMVGLELNNNQLVNYQIYPYFQCKGDVAAVQLMHGEDKEKFFKNVEKLNNIIGDDEMLHEEFEKFVASKEKEYLTYFTPYTSRIGLALYRRGLLPSFINKKFKLRVLNAIRCESHRDVCISLLNKY